MLSKAYETGGYYVWNPKDREPRCKHGSMADAISESERLARIHVGHEFIVLHVVGSAVVEKPSTFRAAPGVDLDNYIPF